MTKRSSNTGKALGLAIGSAGLIGGGYVLMRTMQSNRPHDSAPGRTRRGDFGAYDVVGKSVTISKPRAELFAFWRDFSNLPTFMENIEKVQPTGDNGRAVWTIKSPGGGTVDVETEIVSEQDDELIAWRSVEGSDIDTEGRVKFRDAAADRGTIVEAIIAYKPPAGPVGKLVAKALRRDPQTQARHDLKRFKMLMETGEIATGKNHKDKE